MVLWFSVSAFTKINLQNAVFKNGSLFMEKIHIELLKVLYENNTEISKNGSGWADARIFRKMPNEAFSRKDKQAALLYLIDMKYVKRDPQRVKISDIYPKSQTKYIIQENYRILPAGIEILEKESDKMAISGGLQKMIDSDIDDLQRALADRSNNQTMEYAKLEMYKRIGNAYDPYLPGFGMGLYGYYPDMHIYSDVSGDSLFENLSAMLSKLSTFKVMGYPIQSKIQTPMISFSPSITNTNQNNVIITFQAAKEKIEGMDFLPQSEMTEILERINVLEAVIGSTDNKNNKWEKIKPFLTWIADKSVDVGIAFLPLLLNIH
jgi:hypothetical protein